MPRSYKKNIIPSLLILNDAFFVSLAFLISYYLRNFGPFRIFLDTVQPLPVYLSALPFAILLLLLIFSVQGLYKPKQRLSTMGELLLVSQSITLWALLIMTGSYLVKYDYSRIIVVLFWIMSLVLINFGRFIMGKLQNYFYQKGVGLTHVLIVGAGKPGKIIENQLKNYYKHGFRVIGYLDDNNQKENEKILGSILQLYDVISKFQIHQVYFANPSISYEKILSFVNLCPTKDIEFKITSNIFPLINEITSLHDLEQIPSLNLKKSSPTFFYKLIKRFLDIVLSMTILIVSFPVWIIIMMLIKFDSPGKAVIRQKRVGHHEKLFDMYKFRTMKTQTQLYDQAPITPNDPRITKIGRFLRRTSLDELPQIINVLKGEMSIVGPRPEMPFIVKQYQDWQKKRLEVKPGITGLWQVLGRKDIPLHENLEYDFYYVNNQSLLLDIIIILKTIPQVIFGKGAY